LPAIRAKRSRCCATSLSMTPAQKTCPILRLTGWCRSRRSASPARRLKCCLAAVMPRSGYAMKWRKTMLWPRAKSWSSTANSVCSRSRSRKRTGVASTSISPLSKTDGPISAARKSAYPGPISSSASNTRALEINSCPAIRKSGASSSRTTQADASPRKCWLPCMTLRWMPSAPAPGRPTSGKRSPKPAAGTPATL